MTDLGVRGQRLWDSLLAQDVALVDEANPMREVALTACRTADRVEFLEGAAAGTDPVVETDRGVPMIHPLFAEVRQQAALLARLVSALRLPDEASGRRPQKRQMRGVQKPAAVSSLDRVRAAKGS